MRHGDATRVANWETLKGKVQYPSQLPVSKRAPDIVKALGDHPVLIIAGETGSGKTTQVPKCCLEAGLGKKGRILMTQPRRLAATRTALRLCEELGVPLGDSVGYRVRFNHKAGPQTLLEVVTDGIPVSGDLSINPFKGCDVVIVDEVHERSVNIDLLLGLLKLERERQPHLKVVLMSATLEVERYQEFFPEAHLLQVEGRAHPVQVHHLPRDEKDSLSDLLASSVEHAIKTVNGDILCFLPTERDIRENCSRLRARLEAKVDVLPLFSRLSQKEQDLVFRSGPRRKVILSTNIAETSITLPHVRAVVDSGLVRTLRFQPGRGIPLLEVETISKASARQRMGRAGRTAAGHCWRLYSERTFQAMDDFTTPEIRRQDLAQVMLKLVSMGICQPETFPFPDRPSGRALRSGLSQLEFLGAIRAIPAGYELTKLGRRMVRMPLSPRLSHLIIQAKERDILAPIATIASFLSIQDPKVTPADQKAKARDAHRQWASPKSDFLTMLHLYGAYRKQKAEGSSNALKRWCEQNFLAWRRMLEWEQLRDELLDMVQRIFEPKDRDRHPKRIPASTGPVDETELHRTLLASHLDCLLELDSRHKDGRFRSFERQLIYPHPSSVMAKARPAWAMCASFLTTSRLFAIHLCEIDPLWLLEEAKDQLSITRGDPRYDAKSQKVISEECYAFRSHRIHTKPRRDHQSHDPKEATVVFIREALVRGAWEDPRLEGSRRVLKTLEHFDAALRVRAGVSHEERVVEAWEQRLGICSRVSDLKKRDLDQWTLRIDDVLDPHEREQLREEVPVTFSLDESLYTISYRYAPTQEEDGATLELDVKGLGQLKQQDLEGCVPLYLRERLRRAWEALPRAFKKNFSMDAFTDAVHKIWMDVDESLLRIFELWMNQHTSNPSLVATWMNAISSSTPQHLTPHFCIIDPSGKRGRIWSSVASAQSESREALEARHRAQWRERCRVKIAPVGTDPIATMQAVLKAWQQWPEDGHRSTDLTGRELTFWPELKTLASHWVLNPELDRERAQRKSFIALAQIHGPLNDRQPHLDPLLLDHIARLGEDLTRWVSTVLEVSRWGLWLRLRSQDLVSLKSLRERLLKCEEKYLDKDAKRWLKGMVAMLELQHKARKLPVDEPQALWLQEWCSRLAKDRFDPLQWINRDPHCFQRDLQQADCLLSIWSMDPERGDRATQKWRQLEKNYNKLRQHPLYPQLFGEHAFWEDSFAEELDETEADGIIFEAHRRLAQRQELLHEREQQLLQCEQWLIEARLDLEAEQHPKHRNRKRELLDHLQEKSKTSHQGAASLKLFLELFGQTRQQWERIGGQRQRIMEDEKVVEKDRLTSALSVAWGAKKKSR